MTENIPCSLHSEQNVRWHCKSCGIALCSQCEPVAFQDAVYCMACDKKEDESKFMAASLSVEDNMSMAEPQQAYAGLWVRCGAFVSDAALVIVVRFLCAHILGEQSSLMVMIHAGLLPLYLMFSHRYYGQSLGKKMFNLVVVRADGDKLTWSNVLWRYSVYLLWSLVMFFYQRDLMEQGVSRLEDLVLQNPEQFTQIFYIVCFYIAWLAANALSLVRRSDRRAWHDLMGGTMVLRRDMPL